jgi:hypothetical protein
MAKKPTSATARSCGMLIDVSVWAMVAVFVRLVAGGGGRCLLGGGRVLVGVCVRGRRTDQTVIVDVQRMVYGGTSLEPDSGEER